MSNTIYFSMRAVTLILSLISVSMDWTYFIKVILICFACMVWGLTSYAEGYTEGIEEGVYGISPR